jgi:Acetyltransferase (GNAT) domain
MLRVERYEPKWQPVWDEFVSRSKNGVFLFQRSYMEYHADRFIDNSLLFFDGDKLIALLPANRREDALVSHAGLTFGGFVTDHRMKTPVMLQLFDALKAHCRDVGVTTVVYKVVPHIYHRVPAEEDLYALFVHGGRLVRRDVSSSIRMRDRVGLSKGRKWAAKRARSCGLAVRPTTDFESFMAIKEEDLRLRYNARPTHTAAELRLLAERFPDNIKLFGAYRGDVLLGGVVVYESPRVAHTQYIATTQEGKELPALDCVLDGLLNETYADKPYFDFGISTEDGGRALNVGLIENKESYGARAVAYDWYEIAA